MIHPARTLPFAELQSQLAEAVELGLVSVQSDGPLRLYCYTRQCVYERKWNEYPVTRIARGLILDHERVVATPFPKFFNVGELDEPVPNLPFETYEKVDGSLIIVFHYDGRWRTATKGSFKSDQARWAEAHLAKCEMKHFYRDSTYLAEVVYPENRIVVRYAQEGLVLLGAYDCMGWEHTRGEMRALSSLTGHRLCRIFSYKFVSHVLDQALTLPSSEEGFVLCFSNGHRLKVKGDEYRRIHALISRCTPLAIWESMRDGDDMALMRQDLPEEFWADFDSILSILDSRLFDLVTEIRKHAQSVSDWSNKEVGLYLPKFPAHVRSFIFPYRTNEGDLFKEPVRRRLFEAVRPTGNRLDGYEASRTMNRVMEE